MANDNSKGIYPKEHYTHDQAVKELLVLYKSADKRHYTDLFLSGLNRPTLNGGFGAYALMKNFTEHTHVYEGEIPKDYPDMVGCEICGSYLTGGYTDWPMTHDIYMLHGNNALCIYDRVYVLRKCNVLDKPSAIKPQDFAMFAEIISFLQAAEPKNKIQTVATKLKTADFYQPLTDSIKAHNKSGVSMVKDTTALRIKTILETLGLCGILHSEEQRGFFFESINVNKTPSPSSKSNWYYPVDFWRGQDGIDWNAFDYWFGDYEELKSLRNNR
ncbi:MAG: hypothetical protein LBC96_04840 [Lachnospiraceae bacterium]|jgi:hypothetical protein|nr:hypothetical protein [Lachnospiraceae bacterium]